MEYRCRKCELSKYGNFVPGEGDIYNGVFVLGQSPGVDEDRTRRPFVGRSGQLLDILLKYSGFERSKLWITNTLHCYNGTLMPNNNHISTCTEHFFEKEVDKGDPKIVIALGSIAINYLTSIKNVSEARNKKYFRTPDRGFITIPTYHPSWALRRGTKRKDVTLMLDDFKRARKIFDVAKKYDQI